MEQIQRQKSRSKQDDSQVDETPQGVTEEELTEAAEAALDKIDDILGDQDDLDLLAEMDDVLEVDAEQFVREYVQQGGE